MEYPSAMSARGETSPVPFTPSNPASLTSMNGTTGRLSGGCPLVATGEKPAEETEHRLIDVMGRIQNRVLTSVIMLDSQTNEKPYNVFRQGKKVLQTMTMYSD